MHPEEPAELPDAQEPAECAEHLRANAVAPSLRPFFLALGIVFVGIGYVGYLVPGMPGTVFMLMALWAFKRSSPRMEDWLLNKSVLGPTLRDWEQDKSIRKRTKVLAIAMVWASIGFSAYALRHRPSAPWLIPILLGCAVGVTIYLWTRKTKVEHFT